MTYKNLKNSLFALIALICISSFSCKSTDYSESKKELADAPEDTIVSDDIKESHEDLLTVDYKQFYDELAPHGEWIEVTSEDLKAAADQGVNNDEETDELNEILKDRSSTFQKMTLASLFGINDAYADVNVGAFFVWRPDPSLAVAISAGPPPIVESEPVVVPAAMYRPYTNGQWVATDEGWYFKAPTVHEEIVHHYGRWAYSPAMGWVWVPGRVRSPAWVYWREDVETVAWTPVPPDIYIVDNSIAPIPVVENNYVIVEKRYFVEPVVYQHVYIDRIKVKKMKRLDGLIVANNVIINRGPQIVEIERYVGRPVVQHNIVVMNNDFRNTWIENNRVNTFAPVFTKVKEKKNRTMAVTQPEKFNKFQEVWNRENRNSAGNKLPEGLNNSKGKESRELKENKQFNKKLQDDSDMRTGKKKSSDVRKEKINKERKEQPQKEMQKEIKKNRDDRPKKEVNKERRDKPKREDKPKKDNSQREKNKDVKKSVERNKDNPKGNDRTKDSPKREKKHR